MSSSSRFLLAAVLVCGAAGPATAQVVTDQAATVGESYARGFADIVRSQGQYNLQTSQAMINATTARSQQLDNDLQQTQVFFEKRALNKQQRFGDYPERAARNAQKQMIHYGQAGRPKRLTSRELDPLTGRINWPVFLQGPEYEQPRQTINAIMQQRASQEGAIGLEGYDSIMGATDQMFSILRGKIREMNSTDYVNTKNFIDRLVYDVKNPVT